MFEYDVHMSSSDPLATVTAIRAVIAETASSDDCTRVLGDMKRLRGWLDATEARFTRRMSELHEADGTAPAADLHTKCGGVSAAEGKRKERRSKTLDDAPSFGDALETGEISAEHVDALANATSSLPDDVKDQLLDYEDDLLDDARRKTPEEFARSCRDLARKIERDNGLERNRRQRKETFLSRKLNAASGMIEGRFALHPELANKVFGPVDRQVAAMITEGAAAGDPECQNRTVDRNRLAAEALGDLVAAGHQQIRPGHADVTVIVDHQTAISGELHDHSICETSDGSVLPPASIQRLMCGANVTPIHVDSLGNPFDHGRTIRHANRAQRRALRALHRTCAFRDCDVAFERCEIHHIVPWELGGPTNLINLLPICSRHHHLVHEQGWTLELSPERILTIRQPDGSIFTTCEPDVPPRRQGRRACADKPADRLGREPDRQPAA
jgi:hypothetical protein